MARQINKLTVPGIDAIDRPGYHGDGGGLYLQVVHCYDASGDPIPNVFTKSWIFKYTLYGKQREMGLGPIRTIGLADARKMGLNQRKLLLDGKDPIAERDAVKLVVSHSESNR